MKSIKYIAMLLLGASAVTFTGCDDFLDKAPDSRTIIVSPEQIRQLLVDAYSPGNYAALCELSSDNVIDNQSPDPKTGARYNLSYRSLANLEAFCWEDVKSDNQQDSPSSVWEGAYHSIAVCNQALLSIKNLEDQGRGNEVKAHKGEALICRAYNHFVLANMFCMPYAGPEQSKSIPGIPYMTQIEDKVLVHYERGNLADVYDHIQADIEEALPLIDDALYEIPKYHFNRKAAYAFAARFYLFKRDYEKVEEYANLALGGPGDEAMQIMRTWWSMDFPGGGSDSQILGYCSPTEACNFLMIATNSAYNRIIGGRFAHSRDAINATIKSSGPTWKGWTFHPCFNGKMWIRGSQDYGAFIMKCGELFEYTDKIAGIGYVHVVRCEFTAEETLLCRAEARYYLGRYDEALRDLFIWDNARWQNLPSGLTPNYEWSDELVYNFYGKKDPGYGIVSELHIDEVCPSDRYSVNLDKKYILDCILHYRRIETIDDGYRWWDLNRYGIEIDHHIGLSRVEHLSIHDERRALQIPADVLSAGFEPNRTNTVLQPQDNSDVRQGADASYSAN